MFRQPIVELGIGSTGMTRGPTTTELPISFCATSGYKPSLQFRLILPLLSSSLEGHFMSRQEKQDLGYNVTRVSLGSTAFSCEIQEQWKTNSTKCGTEAASSLEHFISTEHLFDWQCDPSSRPLLTVGHGGEMDLLSTKTTNTGLWV